MGILTAFLEALERDPNPPNPRPVSDSNDPTEVFGEEIRARLAAEIERDCYRDLLIRRGFSRAGLWLRVVAFRRARLNEVRRAS